MNYKKDIINAFELLPAEKSKILLQKGEYGVCAVCKSDAGNGINISYNKIIPICDECLKRVKDDIIHYFQEDKNSIESSVEITPYIKESKSDFCKICSAGNQKEYNIKIGIHTFSCCKSCLRNLVKKITSYEKRVNAKYNYKSVEKKIQLCKNRHYHMLSEARRKYIIAGGTSDSTEKANYLSNLNEMELKMYNMQVSQPINCATTNFRKIEAEKENAYVDKVSSLRIYPAMKYVECQFGAHTNPTDAVYMMSIKENNGTRRYIFSFCEDCINNFSYVLKFIRKHVDVSYSKENISVVKSAFHNNQHCFFCGKSRGDKRTFIIGSVEFDICDECRELLEINLYLQKNYFLKLKEAEGKAQEKAREKENQKATPEKDNEAIEKSESLIEAQKNYLIDRKKFVHDFIKNNSAPDYSEKALKCITNKKDLRIIGYPAKNAKWNPVKNLNVVYRFMKQDCNCIKHSFNNRAVAIIETGRNKDNFCFALCEECISQILDAMKCCQKVSGYFDDNCGLYVYQSRWSVSEHCIFCGSTNGKEYVFRFNSVQFLLCENCFEILMNTLKSIYDNLH